MTKTMPSKQYWLMKSEPHTFSLEHLKNSPNQTTCWDGVRNYQARNFMRDTMRVGDGVLFYHSTTEPVGIFGTARVVREGYPDPSQFNAKSTYFDPDSTPDAPRWFCVDVQYVKTFKAPLLLKDMRCLPELAGMMLLQKGSRLSVQPVSKSHWDMIVAH